MSNSLWLKRTIRIVGIAIILLLGAAFLVPVIFKDKILNVVKTEINKNINATVDFKDFGLSVFTHFPKLTFSLQDIYVANKAPFLGDTLIAAKNIEISIDLIKVFNGKYEVNSIDLINPRINALVNSNGKANWDITIPDTSNTTTDSQNNKPFQFSLQSYNIEDGDIHYADATSKMEATIHHLNHKGSGNFSSDAFVLKTTTTIDALSFSYGNISYLNAVKTVLDLDLDVDNKNNKYTFNTDKIQLNGLKLAAKGFVQMPDSLHTNMDISFQAPGNDFKEFLSLIPVIYKNDFKDIKTSGTAKFDGFVKGTYSANQMPAYAVNLQISNGSFKYPDLPQSVNDIQISMKVNNPDGITDHTIVDIQKGHLAFGPTPIDFRLLLKTPVSAPWIDAACKGHLDLASMQKFVKMEDGTKLTGLLDADIAVKGAISAAQKGNYEALDAKGNLSMNQVFYASKDYPDGVTIQSLVLNFNPKNVNLANLSAKYLGSSFSGDGTINNLLGYYFHNDALSGNFNLKVDQLDMNKWMGTSSSTSSSTTTSSTPFIVPDNLNVGLNAAVGKVLYDKITITNATANMSINDQTVFLKDLSGKALNGTFNMSGSYSTKTDKKNPDIQFSYKVQQVDIKQTYDAFVTVQKLMPIGKFLNGTINSELSVKGKLGKDMTPDMTTLKGDGNLLLLQGVLSKFAPIDQIAEKLSINQLKGLSLKDLKTWFSFQNGRISVQPFTVKVGDLSMEIGGSHGIDQSLQYAINMSVPRSIIGSQGTALVNNLVSKANTNGVPVKLGDVVHIAINVGGTITNPTIKTDLKEVAGNVVNEVKQQIENEVKARTDSLKKAAADSLNAAKNQAIKNAAKDLQNTLSGNKDSANNLQKTGKDLEGKAKGLINNLFNKKK